MRKGSLSRLDLLKGPPWPTMRLETMLVSTVHAAVHDHDEVQDPCGRMQSVLLPDALVMLSGFAALGSHVDVSGLCNHLRPC